jgi:alkyl hydroperoxide reductase subunit AhpC
MAAWSPKEPDIHYTLAVFIIDRAGVIRFVHANPDYTTRISPDALLDAARTVAAGK